MAKRDHAKKVKDMREWSDDELRMLDKAVKKFPMGTPRRWEQVMTQVTCYMPLLVLAYVWPAASLACCAFGSLLCTRQS